MKIDPKNPHWSERDRFILSKGHAIDAYYCVLADRGFLTKRDYKHIHNLVRIL